MTIPQLMPWIGGPVKFEAGLSPLVCPIDETVASQIIESDAKVVDAAVKHAHAAFLKHQDATTGKRVEWLLAAADAIDKIEGELVRSLIRFIGKPRRAATFEAKRVGTFIRACAAQVPHLAGEVLPLDVTAAGAGRFGFTTRVPYGEVAAVTPFNGPANLLIQKVAPALAVGNAVVVKPSPPGTEVALLMAQAVKTAGVPDGLFNVVPGGHARCLHCLRHQQRDLGAGRRRLDDDGIADRQRRRDLLNEEIGGPVERGDRGHHAIGHACRVTEAAGACRRDVERQHFARKMGHLRGACADECAHALGLEGCGPARLADEANERADQLAFDLVDGVGRRQQPLDPLAGGRILMIEECRMGVLDRGIDHLGVGLDDLRGHGVVDGAYERRQAGFEYHRPADPRHQLRYGHRFFLALLGFETFYTCWPSLIGMSRSVLGANSSSSLTRRSVSPCSWVYWSSASIVGRFASMP